MSSATLLRLAGAAGLAGLLGLAACTNSMTPKPEASMQPSLYERLGGKPAITAVVDDFVGNVAADPRINGFFAHANIPHLKMELVDQICQASGGPCTYTGKSMKDAHHGMGITGEAFNDLVGDLKKSLDKFKVPEKEQSELIGALAPMKTDIVEKP
jgi:hemoglobin